MIIFVLPFLMLIWHALEDNQKLNVKNGFLLGILSSLSLLNKITFLPLLVVAGLVLGIFLCRMPVNIKLKFKFAAVYIISFLLTTVIVAFSIFPNLIRSVLNLLHHKGASLNLEGFIDIAKFSLFKYPTLLIVVAFLMIILVKGLFQKDLDVTTNFSNQSKKMFLMAGFLFFIYTFFITYGYNHVFDSGIPFRNVMPFNFILPFCVLFFYDSIGRTIHSSKIKILFVFIFFSFFVNSLSENIKSRNLLLHKSSQLTNKITSYIEGLDYAFWDGSGRSIFNHPATFHYWGSYTYGRKYFNSKITEVFPTVSLFNLRDVVQILMPKNKPESKLRNLLNHIRRLWGIPVTPPKLSPFSKDDIENLNFLFISERELKNERRKSNINLNDLQEYLGNLKPINATKKVVIDTEFFILFIFN